MARLRPSISQLGTGALVVAALSVGQALNDTLPEPSDGTRLFEERASIAETVSMRTGDLRVFAVEGATSILRDVGSSIRSPGMVLVVKFQFVPRGESSGISYGVLTDGTGRVTRFSSFGQRNEVSCPAGPVGIRSYCTAVVEVDPATLPGARLGLSQDALDPRFDSQAVIDLDISKTDVARWKNVEELPVQIYRLAGR